MRIIDKNHDFYDYLQDPTDNRIIFDRRNSFLLEKKHVCKAMKVTDINQYSSYMNKYWTLELQCGVMFWKFTLIATEYGGEYIYPNVQSPINYDVELIESWKDYDAPSKIIDIYVDRSGLDIKRDPKYDKYYRYYSKPTRAEREYAQNYKRDYSHRTGECVTSLTVTKYNETKTYDIPILRGCGITHLINPVDVFCSIEEHFSRQITAAERTEPLGATNNDKIIMHGFDTKTSFRGKQKYR